jgi:SRSO17 transposase
LELAESLFVDVLKQFRHHRSRALVSRNSRTVAKRIIKFTIGEQPCIRGHHGTAKLQHQPNAWHKITWREATAEALASRFDRVRVRAAHRDYWLAETRPEEWLLIERPEGEEARTRYWFSTLPANIALRQFVDTAKLR